MLHLLFYYYFIFYYYSLLNEISFTLNQTVTQEGPKLSPILTGLNSFNFEIASSNVLIIYEINIKIYYLFNT